jgi:hypothetical protein
MFFQKRQHITTLEGLLDALLIDPFDSRKTYTRVTFDAHMKTCHIDEHFDDGKGHSNAFGTRRTTVALEVFEEARRKGFLTGLKKPGYTSNREFELPQGKYGTSTRMDARELVDLWKKKGNDPFLPLAA